MTKVIIERFFMKRLTAFHYAILLFPIPFFPQTQAEERCP
ncbi:hypothetical protein RIEGSTA812A_PEG_314 [invertebrate metagenome]|uniref:Uncharacterized protein n=1 Tax=invertebrate metagenome TaxID=1711999 RepID=A0A484H650_9ZZZZ